MDAATAKSAQNAADRRLVEYFLIISTTEKSNKKKNKANSNKSNNNSNGNNNGDMTFSDWRTEASGVISSDHNNSNNNNNNNNMHEHYNSHISLQPKITARYPLIDHYDHPLQDENVIFFCYPSGSISIRTQPHMPKVRTS